MHTILLPYDFSAAAKNAAEFAIELFRNSPCRFLVVHVTSEGLKSSRKKEIENELNAHLKSLKQDFSYQHTFDMKVISGKVIDELIKCSIQSEVDAILMGTKGESDIRTRVMGSNTAGMIEKSSVPVMSIPGKARFHGFRRMVLATDYRPVKGFDTYEYLMKLMKLSNSEFIVLHVERENELVTMERTMSGLSLDKSLASHPHRYDFIQNDSPLDGILEYVKENNVELLALLKRDNAMISNSMRRSLAGETVMAIDIPFLSLPDEGEV